MQVGAQHGRLAGKRGLQLEVAVLFHAGEFDHAAQLDLAPSAPYLRGAQRLHEPPGLGAQLLLPLGERGQVRRELAAFPLPARFDGGQRLLHLVQRSAHRIEHGLNALLPLGQVVLRRAPERLETRRGEVEEPPGVRVEAGRRQGLERPLEPLFGVLAGRQPLGVAPRPGSAGIPAEDGAHDEAAQGAEDEVDGNRHGPMMMDRGSAGVKPPANT